MPVYDFKISDRTRETVPIAPQQIIMIDGFLIFADERLRDLMDVKIYVDTDNDLRFIRRLERDIKERGRHLDSVLKQYEETVRPMYLQFIEPSKRYADLIVPRGGGNRIAIDMIKAKMRELLKNLHHI